MNKWVIIQGKFVVCVILLILSLIAYDKIFLEKKRNYTKLHADTAELKRITVKLQTRVTELERICD